MNKLILCFTFLLLMYLTLPLPAMAQVVDIPDPNLRAAIEKVLGKASGAPITADEMTMLLRLDAREAGISDLTGLEGATNLARLDLGDNAIRDISVLAGLTNLTELALWDNNITDISALAGLTKLTELALGYNAITGHSILSGLTNLIVLDLRGTNTSDLSVLSGLTNLTGLYIDSNGISNLSPLSGLTNLTNLGLNSNSISDLSPLRGLTNLGWMRLVGNNISDLSPLVANTGLGNGDQVLLNGNPLNALAINTHIPALQIRGVTVEFDNVIAQPVSIPDSNLRTAIETILDKAPGATITTWDMARLTHLEARNANISNLTGLEHATNLTRLDLGHNAITDISVLAGLTNLTILWLSSNDISDISPLIANTGLGSGDEVLLNNNPLNSVSIKTYVPTLQSRGIIVEIPFATIPFDINNIPEPVPLPAAVRDFFKLDPFYQQWINVEGLPIVASEKANPYALKEAAWLIWHMTRHRPEILKAMAQRRLRVSITAHNEMSSDIPELRDYASLHFFLNVSGRGGTDSEEQLLGSQAYSVLIHEFSHAIHDTALSYIDPTFDNRLKAAYDAAMEKGLWRGYYAATNRHEYWADGTNSWFDSIVHNTVNTRAALKTYDPALAALLAEVFGDYPWRYTPLATRTHLPHLQGFDPQLAPRFEYPPGVLEAYEELSNPASMNAMSG